MTRPQHAWVEVDLDALEHNISVLKHRAGRAAFAAVVKANGYGLGALAMAESAMAVGAERVCVYNLDEAAFLRAREFKPPILVMGHVPPADAEWALDLDVSLVVTQPDAIAALARAATARRVSLRLHVKVDTGMFRLGAASEAAVALAEAVRAQSSLELEGFCTHFPSADGPDPADTENRFRRFQELAERVGATMRHVAGTATVLRFPQMSLDMVRVGAGIYGIAPGMTGPPEERGLKAVMSWKAFVVQTHDVPAGDAVSYGGTWTAPRDSRVGVVATGYADGFRRSLGNRGFVLVKGSRAPVVGAVCMDMILVDLTDVPAAGVGDVAVIVGRDGTAAITLDQFAALCETIPYEVIVGLGTRLPRLYLRNGRPLLIQRLWDQSPVATTAERTSAAGPGG